MHSDHLYCHGKRCCRKPIACLCLAMLLIMIGVLMGLHAVNRKIEAMEKAAGAPDLSAFATKEELKALRDEGLSLFGGLKSEVIQAADIEIDGLKKESHKLRKALADELRKELTSAVRSESVIRGQQILTERSQRRNETGELFDARNKTYDALLRHQDEITALRKQLFAVEQAALKHRCPEPCKCSHTPPAPAKILPAPVPNMYTIPYQGAYTTPRCPR